MTNKEFQKIVQQTVTNINALGDVKGKEYANDNDRLANFKGSAIVAGCTPEQDLLCLVDKHYRAISNFVRSQAAEQEMKLSDSIEARIDDIIVYMILFKALLAEGRKARS